MSQKPGPVKPTHPPQVSEATIQRMLAVQEQKITLELKQAEISLREIDHNQKIADKSIEAQAADRKDERAVQKTMHLHRLVFAGAIVAALIIFILIALAMDKDALVLDIVKVLIGFAGGWGASIAWSSHKRSQEE
jgi:hypothetical protein